ncbi:MAG: ABC transporter ATP-binding protein [Acidobacteria bacterium]|nr:ABC transporter ATP-binding protein [Acidobacteriota bacterium]MBV9070560.1 ABC transporter ATP-binding protein [Acidobacteriota bacterium]MBV9184791.1 ABC transporter ATP-binding protein [Acidobacteriota bacterium]
MNPLQIESVVKTFASRRALDGVSLDLRPSEVLGLLGPNGAGKSTLVRTIMGRVQPDTGSVTIFGKAAPAGDTEARAEVGVVPQEIALYPNLSSHENLTVFGRYLGLRGKSLDEAITRSLDWAALSDRKTEPVKSFSGGMKRRLNMAVGVLHRPRVLLLDEPTVGVDPQSRERIYQMIESLRADGVSLIYTTHYMEEAERLCDRIAVIDSGRVIATGTKDELVRDTIGTKREVIVEFADGSRVTHLIDDAAEMLRVMREAETQGSAVRDLTMKSPSLEKVFLHLTGKGLRE